MTKSLDNQALLKQLAEAIRERSYSLPRHDAPKPVGREAQFAMLRDNIRQETFADLADCLEQLANG